MYIDTHSHLYAKEFINQISEEVSACKENGVSQVLLPNIDLESISSMHEIYDKHPDFFKPMMGLHPCSVKEDYKDVLNELKKLLFNNSDKYIAVGEIGIDLYWDKTTLGIQEEAFRTQIEWAKELNLPIVIHARDAFKEIFKVLDEEISSDLKGVFHCFTGNQEEAEKALSYNNFYLGIGGVVTFKNGGLDKTLVGVDVSRLVLETDAPYLAPTPYRGKTNRSAYIPLIADKLADVYQCSGEDIAEVTTNNARELFNL